MSQVAFAPDVFTWPADVPGDRQVLGEPKVGDAQLYGAPGTAVVSIITR